MTIIERQRIVMQYLELFLHVKNTLQLRLTMIIRRDKKDRCMYIISYIVFSYKIRYAIY